MELAKKYREKWNKKRKCKEKTTKQKQNIKSICYKSLYLIITFITFLVYVQ